MMAKNQIKITPWIKLRALRESQDLTQKKFAKAIGVNPSEVSRWESGKKPILLKWAKKISKGFKVDHNFFS